MGLFTKYINAITEGVKVNAAWKEEREGRTVWLKRRRWAGAGALAGANLFFRLAGAPVRALRRAAWQRWEVETFLALHGAEGFRSQAEGIRTVAAEALPGENLTHFLDGGTMTPAMAAAAGRELRRTHALQSDFFGGGWSHGDAHAGNFIYDAASERARLIDYELRHHPRLSTGERQRDDVLGFLLDMVGRIAADQWQPCARSFLDAYGEKAITAQIAAPDFLRNHGGSALWLRVRTTFLPKEELAARWAELSD